MTRIGRLAPRSRVAPSRLGPARLLALLALLAGPGCAARRPAPLTSRAPAPASTGVFEHGSGGFDAAGTLYVSGTRPRVLDLDR